MTELKANEANFGITVQSVGHLLLIYAIFSNFAA